jgi:hypothetical protein
MCYSGKCIWEKDSGDCGYPRDVFFRKIFPHTMCYFGDVDDDTEFVKRLEIAYECHKELRKLKLDQQHERVGILKQAERKLKLLKIFSDEQIDNRDTTRD